MQKRQCENLSAVNIMPIDNTNSKGITRGLFMLKDQYITQCAKGAYIASVCQPKTSFNLFFAAQVINPKKANTKKLNKHLSWQIQNLHKGLKFVKLEAKTL